MRVRKIRGEGRREVSTPKPQPLNPLLFRRLLSYPLSLHPLNQHDTSRFKHLNPRIFPWFITNYLLTKTLPNVVTFLISLTK